MKLTVETGTLEMYLLLPTPTIIWEPKHKTIEAGIYFLNYYFTIKIKIK